MNIFKITKENGLFDYKKLAKLDYSCNIRFYEDKDNVSLESLENAYKDFLDSDETLYVLSKNEEDYDIVISLDEFNDNYFTMMFDETKVSGSELVEVINYMLDDFVDKVTLHTNVDEEDELLVDALGIAGFEFYGEEGSTSLEAEITK